MTASNPPQRRHLRFRDLDEVIAEIRTLQRGYARAGNWSLPQVCWHLEVSVANRMKPGPYPANTPEQEARRPVFEQVLASGRLPDGIVAPEPMVPPPDCGDEAIEACIKQLERFKGYTGRIPPHRIFGDLPDDEARQLNLIHCAHHLGYLVPTGG